MGSIDLTDLQTAPTEYWAASDYRTIEPDPGPTVGAFVRWARRDPGDPWDDQGVARARVATSALPLVPLVSAMMAWRTKSDDWFGGEDRPALFTMQRALHLLTLHQFTGPLPVVRPTASGGVQFEWMVSDTEVEIETLPSGQVVLMIDDGDEIFSDETHDLGSDSVRRLLDIVRH